MPDGCPRCGTREEMRDDEGRQTVVWCECGQIDCSIPDELPPEPDFISCLDGGRCEDYPCCGHGTDGPVMFVIG